jgi:ferredoxin
MPKIMAEGKTFEVNDETNLRDALLNQDVTLYSPKAKVFNCGGLGICGTCLVQVEGAVSEPTKLERSHIGSPPRCTYQTRRQACQTKVLGDVCITKFNGHFGGGKQVYWTPEQGLRD